MKRGKKWLIALGVLTAIVVTLFIVFHDNADVEKIAREQKADAEVTSVDMTDDLNASFDE
ncbi:MAG: hypothetical protein ACI9N1_000578 [Flavobacteriales bacterium]|jgi:hypothetical protein